ncbi:unnamed protein product [Arctogadus glacialis]
MVSGTPSNSTNNSGMPCQNPQGIVGKILPPVLILEMIVGLPGTLLALWIFCFRLKQEWKPNTLFLFNLVLADFFLLVSVPFRIHNILHGEYWWFGDAWCRINLFMLAVNRSASIAFMTTVAVDRYLKVVHPHHRINHMTKNHAPWLAFLIWAVVLALRLPLLAEPLLYKQGDISLCRSFGFHKISLGITIHYVVYIGEFFLPLAMLIFCTARIACVLHQRRLDREQRVQRAVRVVATIVAVFVVCFSPGIMMGLVGWAFMGLKQDCKRDGMVSQLFRLSIGFTYLNSALDPIIYSLSSSMFRDAIKSLFYSLTPGGKYREGRNLSRSTNTDG